MEKKRENRLVMLTVFIFGLLCYTPWHLFLSEARILDKNYGSVLTVCDTSTKLEFALLGQKTTVDVGLVINEWAGLSIFGVLALLILMVKPRSSQKLP